MKGGEGSLARRKVKGWREGRQRVKPQKVKGRSLEGERTIGDSCFLQISDGLQINDGCFLQISDGGYFFGLGKL